jgi:predicted RNase H-like nuclease (RuvC/YqgF family)
MNEQLKRCSICGSPAEKMWDLQEKLVRCTNRTCHNSLYSVYLNEWQERPIEDELQTRIAALSTRIAEFEAENKWLKAKYERLKAIAERVGLIIDNANDEFLRELQSIKLQQKRGPDLDEWGNRRHSNE